MSINTTTPSAYADLNAERSVLALWYITNTSLISYYKLLRHFGDVQAALCANAAAWQGLSIHAAHIKRWREPDDVLAFVTSVAKAVASGSYGVLFTHSPDYPPQLHDIYDPPPVLFYRGEVARLKDRQIAIVGSRNPSQKAAQITFDMAQYLAAAGFTITSGLAQGVDKQAHLGAMAQTDMQLARTVGVLGTGIDVCYPRNHNALFAQIIQAGGCLLSELLPGTPASKHTFPRRNRLVAGLSLATLVTEAAVQSGSLITARLSAEQGKQVFAVPGQIDNVGAEGCHHLIREGATLIYHPEQILEDLAQSGDEFYTALPKTFAQGMSLFSDGDSQSANKPSQKNSQDTASSAIQPANEPSAPSDIPAHLIEVYEKISSTAQDLDTLVIATQLEVGVLLAKLIELEILGLISQTGGRYARI